MGLSEGPLCAGMGPCARSPAPGAPAAAAAEPPATCALPPRVREAGGRRPPFLPSLGTAVSWDPDDDPRRQVSSAVVPVLQIRKLRLRGVTQQPQGHSEART